MAECDINDMDTPTTSFKSLRAKQNKTLCDLARKIVSAYAKSGRPDAYAHRVNDLVLVGFGDIHGKYYHEHAAKELLATLA